MREMNEDSGGEGGATVLYADSSARVDANSSPEPTVPHAASAAHKGHSVTALRMKGGALELCGAHDAYAMHKTFVKIRNLSFPNGVKKDLIRVSEMGL
jgi:hypothetical protein